MKYVRMYAGPDGESHFEDVEVQVAPGHLLPGNPLTYFSTPLPASSALFVRSPADWDAGKHRAPRRQFVVALSGEMEVQTSDGAVRRFGPGAVLLAEDVVGNGHFTRIVGESEFWALAVPIAE